MRGLLNAGLSMATAGMTQDFRRCLRDVILNKLAIKVGESPPHCEIYRATALRTLLPRGGGLALRRALLAVLPNGDWTNQNEVEVYLNQQQADVADFNRLASDIASALVAAMLQRKIRVFTRNRWLGQEEAVCDVSLLETVHGLFSAAYCAWARQATKAGRQGASARNSEVGEVAEGNAPDAEFGRGEVVPRGGGDADDSGLATSFGLELAGEATTEAGAADPNGPSFAEHHAKFRANTLEFIGNCDRPMHAQLIVLRMVLAPLQAMMRKQLIVSSGRWELRQRATAAKATPAQRSAGLVRDYQVLVAARCNLEASAMLRLRALLFDNRLWTTMLPSHMTNGMRALAFLSISRAAARTDRLLQHPHSKMPYLLFLTLDQPGIAEEVKRLPLCMWDQWSLDFAGVDDIASADFRAKLLLHVMLVATDSAQCEAGHSQIRRFVKSRVQTSAIRLADLSAQWIGQHFRHHSSASQGPTTEEEQHASARARATQAGIGPQPRLRSGGPWRAFVRQERSADLRSVADRYRDIDRDSEVFQRLLAEGRLATERAQEGAIDGTAFGPKRRKLARQTQARLALARAQQFSLDGNGPQEAVEALLQEARDTDQPLSDTIAMARRLDLAHRHAQEEVSDEELVQKFASENTIPLLDRLVAVAGRLAPERESLQAVPSCMGVNVLETTANSVAADAAKPVQWLGGPGRLSLLPKALDEQWAAIHQLHVETPALEEAAKASPPPPPRRCWAEGVCICHGAGCRLWTLRNRVVACVKSVFNKQELPKRDSLQQSLVIGRFVPRAIGELEDMELAAFWGITERYFHFAGISFSPWSLWVQEMFEVDDMHERLSANPHDDEIPLKATCSYRTPPPKAPNFDPRHDCSAERCHLASERVQVSGEQSHRVRGAGDEVFQAHRQTPRVCNARPAANSRT